MAIQMAQVSIENIDDAEGLNSVMTALKNISGVTAISLDPKHNVATVSYDDTDTRLCDSAISD